GIYFASFSHGARDHRQSHSFPTRRSSDLLACARGGGQSRHPRPRDDYLRANPGLCSTYSMRTRSGPQTKTARVFAASTTLSTMRSEEHTSELQSRFDLVCRLLLEKKKEIA